MGALVIERLGIAGVPEVVQLDVGVQYVAVVPDAARARRLAGRVAGRADLPAGAVVRSGGVVRLVPAGGGLLPHLTVLGNLVRAYRVARGRVPKARVVEACQAWAAQCGLDDVLQRYPYEISPGRRRLAGVARALCADAAVIVLEDADGLPTWGVLLNPDHNPGLLRAALLLITPHRERAVGFRELSGA